MHRGGPAVVVLDPGLLRQEAHHVGLLEYDREHERRPAAVVPDFRLLRGEELNYLGEALPRGVHQSSLASLVRAPRVDRRQLLDPVHVIGPDGEKPRVNFHRGVAASKTPYPIRECLMQASI